LWKKLFREGYRPIGTLFQKANRKGDAIGGETPSKRRPSLKRVRNSRSTPPEPIKVRTGRRKKHLRNIK